MPSIKTLQTQHLDSLNDFGTSESEFQFDNELDLIDKVVGDFIQRVKDNIEADGMIVTGKIDDITIQRTENGCDVISNNYLLYQDLGVNGSVNKLYDTPYSFKDKKPPIQPILNWVKARNIGGENQTATAYAIREKIFQDGFEPRNVFTKELSQLANELAESYANLNINLILK